MKAPVLATLAVAAAASAPKYSTSIYTECTPIADATLTSTRTDTVTHCSLCEETGTPTPGGHYAHTTVMTITIPQFCSTGITESTVTLTESCTDMTPTWIPGNTPYVPMGYTTEWMTCTVCGETPVTHMMTFPTGSPPSYPSPTGEAPAPGSGGTSPPGSAPAGTCPGPECRSPGEGTPGEGSPAPVPAGSPTPAGSGSTPTTCTEGDCSVPGLSPAGTMPPPAGNTSTVPTYPGAAPALSVSISTLLGVIGTIAIGFIAI